MRKSGARRPLRAHGHIGDHARLGLCPSKHHQRENGPGQKIRHGSNATVRRNFAVGICQCMCKERKDFRRTSVSMSRVSAPCASGSIRVLTIRHPLRSGSSEASLARTSSQSLIACGSRLSVGNVARTWAARFALQDVFATKDRVVIRWIWESTLTSGPLPGVEPAGQRPEFGAITICIVKDGRLTERWDKFDWPRA